MNKDPRIRPSAIAQASPNIALIKYWGNRDQHLRIPANGSISITLGDLLTTTRVTLDPSLDQDQLTINELPASTNARDRAQHLLDWIRSQAGSDIFALIESQNSFPMGTGIASSASAFAAMTVAACEAYQLRLGPEALSRIARRASGSAARSLCSGFVELRNSEDDHGAYAESLHPPDYWELIDIIAVVDTAHKAVSSSDGHILADTSPLQSARIADTPRRLDLCREALANRDFEQLAQITELDSNIMHAVMMTSTPALLYWQPATLAIMRGVERWRADGLDVCYSIDAGPNVHCITTAQSAPAVMARLQALETTLQFYRSKPGPGAMLIRS
ncbi:MAG: diphosphomevalonate decarboxylase [Anaerolineales bacterium]|nr:MAG: diphosphomevalonate decarboxylase [Anaerolineales bacterium]